MRTPLRWVMLLASLLAACTTASPTPRHEEWPSQGAVLVGYGEWGTPHNGTRPRVRLITTADTQVSQEVADEAAVNGVAIYHAVAWEDGGLLTVGPFQQRTSFADVPISFILPSLPEPLQLRSR